MRDQAGPCERTWPVRTLSSHFDPTQASTAPPGQLCLRRKASKWPHRGPSGGSCHKIVTTCQSTTLLTALRLPACTHLPRLRANGAILILITDAPAPPATPKAPVTAYAYLCVHKPGLNTKPASPGLPRLAQSPEAYKSTCIALMCAKTGARQAPVTQNIGLKLHCNVSVTQDNVCTRAASICATHLCVAQPPGPSLSMPQAIWIAFKLKHWPAASREPSQHTRTLPAYSRPNQTTTMSDQAGPCERIRPVHTLSGLFDPTQASAAPPGPLGLRRKASKWPHRGPSGGSCRNFCDKPATSWAASRPRLPGPIRRCAATVRRALQAAEILVAVPYAFCHWCRLMPVAKGPRHSSTPIDPLNRWPPSVSVLFLITNSTVSTRALRASTSFAQCTQDHCMIPVSQQVPSEGRNAGGPKMATDFGGKLLRHCFHACPALLPRGQRCQCIKSPYTVTCWSSMRP